MLSTHRISLIVTILLVSIFGYSQKPVQYSSSETYVALQKLNTLLSVLYVAAHPDDENTRLISYCSNGLHANTSYLSLTRGDGGQNLLGTEIGQLLGVLRTQELLAARGIDGGHQYFSRAIDFGYSKHPDETLAFWNKDEVLGDVVRVIRQVRPDIIINRFNHRTPGSTHGHHTTSAMLSVEAFDLAGTTTSYPDQLSTLKPWQPAKLYYNTSWWAYGGKDKFEKADKSALNTVDIGTFYPLLGTSNNEIAAYARSMHKCQGFGSETSRASQLEYLELIMSSDEDALKDLTGDIDCTWNRVPNGQAVATALNTILADYNFAEPSQSVPALIKLYGLIEATGDEYWKTIKLEELKAIIQSVCGLYLEATTESTVITKMDSLEIRVEATNRSTVPINVQRYTVRELAISNETNATLNIGEEQKWYTKTLAPQNTSSYTHYWLNGKNTYGMYDVQDPELIGKPESPALLNVDFDVVIDGKLFTFTRPVFSMDVLPNEGESYQPLTLVPVASVELADDVYIFADNAPKTLTVTVKAMTDNLSGDLSLDIEKGWTCTPKSQEVSIAKAGLTAIYTFEIQPPSSSGSTDIQPLLSVGSHTLNQTIHTIDYDHIPLQTVTLPASAKCVKVDIVKRGSGKLAYIMGAGDEVPQCLEYVGYEVDLLTTDVIAATDLSQYQAILLGIRLYNVNDEIGIHQDQLFDYVKGGGNLITQYMTTSSLKVKEIAPAMLELSRDRVSDETAEVTILEPNHPAMFYPNKLTQADFEGWVQERGLYFADAYDPAFKAVFSMHDNAEEPKLGSLLILPYGDGYYVYTGISFFRELPAGVPGAYRLMTNLISLGTNKR